MGETSNITVIIPIVTLDGLEYKVGEETANYLNTAINSVTTQKVLPEEVLLIVSKDVDTTIVDETIKKS
jgi:2-phospho-L-lactate guanylyltransferase (CobY/MobA/RfbA family)